LKKLVFLLTIFCFHFLSFGQRKGPDFCVVAFYTAKNDPAHISFVHEANNWFLKLSRQYHFLYDSTQDWSRLSMPSLKKYDLVIFLDTRPDSPSQRFAFQQYMEGGGAWMGFHFSAFALTPSAFPQNWAWYHENFLGSGEYVSNTWRPTPAKLRVENDHPVTKGLPEIFASSPNEWYRWKNDLRANKDIRILLSIDSSSFPLGTGPKPSEIWHSGYYPVVWTNTRYHMVYFNMGHNDMDYEGGTNRALSSTFGNKLQDQLITNCVLWLGKKNKKVKQKTR
jgi:hypothetical protein